MTTPEIVRVNEREFGKIQPSKAQEILGITTKHFIEESNKHAWHKEKGQGRSMFHFVPVDYIHMRQAEMRDRENTPVNTPPELPEKPPEIPVNSGGYEPENPLQHPVILEVIHLYEARLAEKDAIIQAKEQTIAAKDEAIRTQADALQTMKATLLLSTRPEQPNKPLEYAPVHVSEAPWWKFWR